MTLNELLFEINMHPDQTNIEDVTSGFLSEMEKGLNGETSSLQMIPTYVKTAGSPCENEMIIAIDAGGTNLRTGLVSFKDGKAEISHFEKTLMYGVGEAVTADEFFEKLANRILPLTEFSRNIGFCFSYPAEIFETGDGKILQLNKEVVVKNSQGKIIGEELIARLRDLGVKGDFKFMLLNDTVAGLMGGIATLDLRHCDGFAGMVLGTGNNSCYGEKGENIKKLDRAFDMVINCESGIFDKVFRGTSDKMVDEESDIPNDHLLEKMIGGVYHGAVISKTMKIAAENGLLGEKFKGEYAPFTSLEIDEFARDIDNRLMGMCTGEDKKVVAELIDNSYERAAKLVCANISALILKTDGGKTKEHPFCLVAEGSSFHNSVIFRPKLEKYVESHINGKLNRYVEIAKAENSTMAGAALAAMLNV